MLEAAEPGGVGRRFLAHQQPSLEAQLCNLADEIAYNAHDVDDGVRSGLLTLEQLRDVPLFDRYRAEALATTPSWRCARRDSGGCCYEAIRRMLSAQVYDVIDTTQAALAQAVPASVHEVRSLRRGWWASAQRCARSQELKHFLLHSLYRHPQVTHTMGAAHARWCASFLPPIWPIPRK